MSRRPDPSGPSDDAVRAATGRGWDDWFARLDAAGAAELDHKAIVAFLRDREGLANGWWQQSVTVAYEKARGMRAPVGETADAGFQVGVQRTVGVGAEAAWAWLVTGPGRDAWLGRTEAFPLEPGASYRCQDGTEGEIRSVDPGRRLRATWRPPDWASPSTVQITITPKDGRSTVGFHQERLPDAETREAMKARWRAVLAELAEQA